MKQRLIFLLFLLVAGGVYLKLATPVPVENQVGLRFDWPDETANAFFASRYASTGTLWTPEPLNLVARNQIHPRSVNVYEGKLVPGTFLGFPLLLGWLWRLLGAWVLLYVTPGLALVGVACFYGVLRRMFEKHIAFLSSIFLLVHPAWWYYSVTPVLPNIAFVSLILAGVYGLVRHLPRTAELPTQGQRLTSASLAVSGVCCGLALAIRPVEVVWVVLVFGVTLWWIHRDMNLARLLIWLASGLLIFAPSLVQQQILYGSIVRSGYDRLQAAPSVCRACGLITSAFIPFGVSPVLIAKNFLKFFVLLLWPFSVLSLLGALLQLKDRKNLGRLAFLGLGAFVTLLLVVFYGSWRFDDPQTVNLNTLGVSYIRYWIPIVLFSLPFAAYGLLEIARWLPRLVRRSSVTLMVIAIAGWSGYLVLWGKPDSILPVRERIAGYRELSSQVNQLTAPESVIITTRKDKVFFPDRRVIHSFEPLAERADLQEFLPALSKLVPVYYYALQPETSLALGPGLQLEEVRRFGDGVLYQIKTR